MSLHMITDFKGFTRPDSRDTNLCGCSVGEDHPRAATAPATHDAETIEFLARAIYSWDGGDWDLITEEFRETKRQSAISLAAMLGDRLRSLSESESTHDACGDDR